MAHISKISFESVGANEGCTCDRCGQYIRNIWTVQFTEDLTMNYGIDCFEKLYKAGNLSGYGIKLMQKTLHSIEMISRRIQEQAAATEDTDEAWNRIQKDESSAWYGESYSEYKRWMLEEFYQHHLQEAQKDVEKFKRINMEV